MSICVLCGGATRDSSSAKTLSSKYLCSLCEVRWKDSPEFRRWTHYTKLKNAGAARSAFSDFVYDRQKIKQAEEAELRAHVEPQKDAEQKALAAGKWEAEKKALAAAPPPKNGASGGEKPTEKPEAPAQPKPVTNGV